jgi:hypothetical protein
MCVCIPCKPWILLYPPRPRLSLTLLVLFVSNSVLFIFFNYFLTLLFEFLLYDISNSFCSEGPDMDALAAESNPSSPERIGSPDRYVF